MSLRFGFAIAALASFASSVAAAGEDGLPAPDAVGLVWVDPAGAALEQEAVARREIQSLLGRMGVPTRWRRGRAGELASADEVRIILLDRVARRPDGTPVLGATPPRFDASPFVWVHVPAIQAAVGLCRGRVREAVASRMLAIALGRVVAHELVHVLAPSLPHGRGLMSECLTRRQLTASSVPVADGVGPAVRAALMSGPSLVPPDRTVLAAISFTEGKGR